jgi:prevent-host-death family protein
LRIQNKKHCTNVKKAYNGQTDHIEKGEKYMHTWQLQQAKSHFSEVVNLVLTEGAQMVTRRGKSEVVILAVSEYQKLTKTVPLNQILKHAPRGNELDITRSQEGVRKIEF